MYIKAASVLGAALFYLEVTDIKELYLISPIPPSVNHYLAYRAVIKNGRPYAVSYKTPEAIKYREEFANYVRSEVVRQNWEFTPNKTRHFYVDTIFYFPATNLDANNYFKVMLDAITDTKMIWLDDNVTCERVQAIYYDPKNPRIEIKIHPVDYIGVFENAPQMESFISRCIGCIRYTRNCRILRQAKEGRIQEEITDGVCYKFKQKKN